MRFLTRLVTEVIVTLFDMVVSRYLIAGVVVGLIWLPFFLLSVAGPWHWFWPTLILGVILCGLWDTCDIFTIRPLFSRWGWVRGMEK